MKLINKCKERGSGVLLCLGILGLLMSISLTFIFSSRSHAELANAQSGTVKAGLLVESGLERALAGMQQTWQPASSLPWYNFTQSDLNSLGQKISGEIFPNDLKDASSLKVRFIYHGGKIDPNWFGNNGVSTSGGFGFSPIGHAISEDDLFVKRDEESLKPLIDENNILWFSRDQVQAKIDPSLFERSFAINGLNNDYFFPFSPRDASSPMEDNEDMDAPYLIVRNDGKKCGDCAYAQKFHANFCEKYGEIDDEGKRRCVYFGGGNTFLDKEKAIYQNGVLTNPEVAIKRRVPFYCLRQLRVKNAGQEVSTILYSKRNVNQMEFRVPANTSNQYDASMVPEYLQGQRLIDCIPWLKKMAMQDDYGGYDNNGENPRIPQNVWRWWQLLSNIARYNGPTEKTPNPQEYISIYDTVLNDGNSNNRIGIFSGRRQSSAISKVRFKRQVTMSEDAGPIEKLTLDLELVNFFAQPAYWGNRAEPYRVMTYILRYSLGGKVYNERINNGNINNTGAYARKIPIIAGGSANPYSYMGTTTDFFTKTYNAEQGAGEEFVLLGLSLSYSVRWSTGDYGGWGDNFLITSNNFSQGADALKLNVEGDDGSAELVLECIDPLNNRAGDAWIVGNSDDWGKPSPSWSNHKNGVFNEGSISNGTDSSGNQIRLPMTSFIRGTFGGYSNVATATEKKASYILSLAEIGAIQRAKPGQTIDLIDKDKELLDQFCLFPGDDGVNLAKSSVLYDLDEVSNFKLTSMVTESGKFNPNAINRDNLRGIDIVLQNMKTQGDDKNAFDFYAGALKGTTKLLPNAEMPLGNYNCRSEAAVALANKYGTSIRNKEEIAGKVSQLMQVRYQYFEIVVKAEVAKRISEVDVRGTDNKKVEGVSILSAVVERDTFTGAVRVLSKRDRFYELRK